MHARVHGVLLVAATTASHAHDLHSFTHSGLFAFYAVLTLVAIVFVYFFFPETKEKTLEEVEGHFEELVARKEGRWLQEEDEGKEAEAMNAGESRRSSHVDAGEA